VGYLSRLAVKAAGGHAHTEAVQILEEAIRHAGRLPASERDRRLLELALLAAYSLIPLGRFQEVIELLGRHQAALDRLGDPTLAGQFHLFVGRSHLFLGDDTRASHHARLGIAEAARCGDAATLGKHHDVLAQQCAMSGRPREGLDHARQAIALFEEANERFWLGPAHWALGLNHALIGEFDAALAAEAQAAALGRAVGDPQVRSSAAWAAGIVHAALGRWDEGIAACREARDLSPDPLNTVMALGWLGYAHLERGEPEPALPVLAEAVRLLDQFRFPQPESMFLALLAEARGLRGEPGAARDLATRALGIARDSNAGFGLGLSQRALGRLALAEGRLDEALTSLAEALESFDRMPAPYDAARTRLDLARTAHARSDVAGARHHLAAAHVAFRALRIPHYEGEAVRLAARLGLELAEGSRP
jgi:tetratricopeptide (TPR) repeat protein